MTPLAGPSKVDHAVLGGAGSDEADTAALTPSVELVSGERPGADAAVSVLSREDILADERTDEDDAIVVQLQAVEESALDGLIPLQVPRSVVTTLVQPEQRVPEFRQPTKHEEAHEGSSRRLSSYLGTFLSCLNPSTTLDSTHTPSEKPRRRQTGHDCVVCLEPIEDFEVRAPCGHFYDIPCLLGLFDLSTRDETLFPPRCCQRKIPITAVSSFISPSFPKHFKQRSRELATPRRVYCANPSCGRFIGAQSASTRRLAFFSTTVTCPSSTCTTRTCTHCCTEVVSRARHVCTADPQDRAALSFGTAQGWARCPGCAQLVERSAGCVHMTCLCKAEFCYLCSGPWPKCKCRAHHPQRGWLARGLRGAVRVPVQVVLVPVVIVWGGAHRLATIGRQAARSTRARAAPQPGVGHRDGQLPPQPVIRVAPIIERLPPVPDVVMAPVQFRDPTFGGLIPLDELYMPTRRPPTPPVLRRHTPTWEERRRMTAEWLESIDGLVEALPHLDPPAYFPEAQDDGLPEDLEETDSQAVERRPSAIYDITPFFEEIHAASSSTVNPYEALGAKEVPSKRVGMIFSSTETERLTRMFKDDIIVTPDAVET